MRPVHKEKDNRSKTLTYVGGVVWLPRYVSKMAHYQIWK
ncbi:uncharacterized protein METZ01_LOCUS288345 [marine metagenome]|uniref:Uncharacterized protein n=1 Tax=marine metagenome TaxID=408172 RepID=A0A382LKT4_9ZZZZ